MTDAITWHEILGYLLCGYMSFAVLAALTLVGLAAFLRDDRWPDTVSWRRR